MYHWGNVFGYRPGVPILGGPHFHITPERIFCARPAAGNLPCGWERTYQTKVAVKAQQEYLGTITITVQVPVLFLTSTSVLI